MTVKSWTSPMLQIFEKYFRLRWYPMRSITLLRAMNYTAMLPSLSSTLPESKPVDLIDDHFLHPYHKFGKKLLEKLLRNTDIRLHMDHGTSNLTPRVSRWTKIPLSFDANCNINTVNDGLVETINTSIRLLERDQTIIALNPHQEEIECLRHPKSAPPSIIFLWSNEVPAYPPLEGFPRSHSTDLKWKSCVAPITVSTHSICDFRAEAQSKGAWRDEVTKLAVMVNEIFAVQPHRRFVPALIITEVLAQYFLWDRSGYICSQPFDYHAEHATTFSMILLNFTIGRSELTGFGPLAGYFRDGVFFIAKRNLLSTSPITYTVKKTLSSSYTIVGSGSVCWSVSLLKPEPKEPVDITLILDTWTSQPALAAQRRVHERLKYLSHSPEYIGLPFFEDIFPLIVLDPAGSPDDIFSNRKGGYGKPIVSNKIHTRSIWKIPGKCIFPLDSFYDSRELVFALRDIVKGLRLLYNDSCILHRNITVWNMLIQHRLCDQEAKGFLVDFSFSCINGSKALPPVEYAPSSVLFASMSILRKSKANFWDDLESLFYAFYWIIGGHTGPGLRKTQVPIDNHSPWLMHWQAEPDTSFENKKIFWELDIEPEELRIQPRFSNLLSLLHEFRAILVKCINSEWGEEELQPLDVFRRVIDLFNLACNELVSQF